MRKFKIVIAILAVALAFQSAVLVYFICKYRAKKAPSAPARLAVAGPRIAIVLDDWGYSVNNLAAAKEIRYPVTFSVLPSLRYSSFVADELRRRGFEVILHLPTQPHEAYRLEKNTILVSMSAEQIHKIVDADLASIWPVKGANNHMGSCATEDYRTMVEIFRELKKRHLYFLDSLVTPASVCRQAAAEAGISFAVRDIFLDNSDDPDYIAGQLSRLKERARAEGYAIGIGHDRKNTLKVLKEMMPRLAKEGFRFVFVSELVR